MAQNWLSTIQCVFTKTRLVNTYCFLKSLCLHCDSNINESSMSNLRVYMYMYTNLCHTILYTVIKTYHITSRLIYHT